LLLTKEELASLDTASEISKQYPDRSVDTHAR
jgi:hypothetical protein